MDLRMTLGALLVSALIAVPSVAAAAEPDDDHRRRQELAEAREQLAAAAARVAELSREHGRHVVEFRSASRRRPMVGVVLGSNADKGVAIQAVTPDGPAARAGLRSGDVITRIEDTALDAPAAEARIAAAQRALAGLEAGQQVRVTYEREGRRAQAVLTADLLSPVALMADIGALQGLGALGRLGDLEGLGAGLDIDIERIRSDVAEGLVDVEKRLRVIGPIIADSVRFDAWRWQGLRLAALDPDLGRYFGTDEGVLVLKAEGQGLAGLQGGDVIERVNGEPVRTPRDAMARLSDAEPGEKVSLSLLRDRRRNELSLTAPDKPDLSRLLVPPMPPEPPAPPPAPRAPELPAPPQPPAPPPPGTPIGTLV